MDHQIYYMYAWVFQFINFTMMNPRDESPFTRNQMTLNAHYHFINPSSERSLSLQCQSTILCFSFVELLVEYISPDDPKIQNVIIKRLSTYCKRPVTNYTLDEYEEPYQWTFYHAMFFAFTVCSTLGENVYLLFIELLEHF